MLAEPLHLAAATEHFPDLQCDAALLTPGAAHAAASWRAPAHADRYAGSRHFTPASSLAADCPKRLPALLDNRPFDGVSPGQRTAFHRDPPASEASPWRAGRAVGVVAANRRAAGSKQVRDALVVDLEARAADLEYHVLRGS